MGRVVKAPGSSAGRIGEPTRAITRARTKRKKRKKDLEKLRRNVVEAKRGLRLKEAQHKKWKTAFTKVLSNFAQKRQEHEDATQGKTAKKGRKRKPKIICNRLLPEPIIGIYKNGAKGREIRNDNAHLNVTKVARVQGDFLKLLNGDETNSKTNNNDNDEEKSSKNPGQGKTKKAFTTDESDSESGTENLVKVSPVLGKTKGIKRTDQEKARNFIERDKPVGGKNQMTELLLQREAKYKRRLFEPDDEDGADENSIGTIDPAQMINEIRFSPSRRIAERKDEIVTEDQIKVLGNGTEDDAMKEVQTTLTSHDVMANNKCWGWSPANCYETLCAMVCADNFENNQRDTRSDPIAKIQANLRRFYKNACQRSARSNRKNSMKNAECIETGAPALLKQKKRSPFAEFGLESSASVEIQACTADSELDSELDDSSEIGRRPKTGSGTKIGSWHPRFCRRIVSHDDSSVFEDNKEMSASKNPDVRKDAESGDTTITETIYCRSENSSTDTVQRTINSVSLFLQQLKKNVPLNSNEKLLEMEMAEVKTNNRIENASNNLEYPCRDLTYDMNVQNLLRRNPKHVPSILRRSSSRNRSGEKCEDKSLLQNDRRLDNKNDNYTDRKLVDLIPTENVQSNCNDFVLSPYPKSDDTEYLQTPEIANEMVGDKKSMILKSKLNFVKAKYNPKSRFVSVEHEGTKSEWKKTEENVPEGGKLNSKPRHKIFVEPENLEHETEKSWDQTRQHFAIRKDGCMNADQQNDCRRAVLETNSDCQTGYENYQEMIPSMERLEESTDYTSYVRPYDVAKSQHRLKAYSSFPPFDFLLPESSGIKNNPRNMLTKKWVAHSKKELRRRQKQSESMAILPNDLNTSVSSTIPQLPSFDTSVDTVDRLANSGQFLRQRCGNQFSMGSEVNNRIQSNEYRSFKSLPSYEEQGHFIKYAGKESDYIHDHQGVNLPQRIRKPVMLFRPIKECHPKHGNSRYEPSASTDMTVNDAVRNLRVLTFEDNVRESSVRPTPQVPQGQIIYTCSYQRQQDQQQQRVQHQLHQQYQQQSHCHQQKIDNRAPIETQPMKYLAVEEPNTRNLRRIPIYLQTNAASISIGHRPNDFTNTLPLLEKPESTRVMYMPSYETENGREHDMKNQLCRQQQQLLDGTCTYGTSEYGPNYSYGKTTSLLAEPGTSGTVSTADNGQHRQRQNSHTVSQVALMLPCPSSCCQQTSNNISTAEASTLCSTKRDVPRIISNMEVHERRLRHELDAPLSALHSRQGADGIGRGQVPTHGLGHHRITSADISSRSQSRSGYNEHFNRDFYDNGTLPKRVQLPDGTIGILVAENRLMGNLDESDTNTGRTFNKTGINEAISERNLANLMDDNIRSQSGYHNYRAVEEYPCRMASTNGIVDTF